MMLKRILACLRSLTILFMMLFLSVAVIERSSVWAAEGGEALDLSKWDAERPVTLMGPWEFYWQRLLQPGEEVGKPDLKVDVGVAWKNLRLPGSPEQTEFGYGTYRLVLRNVPKNISTFSLYVPAGGSAQSVYLFPAGQPEKAVHGQSGIVGISPDQEQASFKELRLALTEVEGQDIVILINISNFRSTRGGLWFPPEFARNNEAGNGRNASAITDMVALGSLIGLGFYTFMIWWRERRDWSSFFLSFACAGMVVRILSTNPYGRLLFSDDAYGFIKASEYASITLSSFSFSIFLYLSFPAAWLPKALIHMYTALTGLMVVLAYALPDLILTRSLFLYQAHVLVSALAFVIMIVHAQIRRYEGSHLAAAGVFLVVATIVLDVLISKRIVQLDIYLSSFSVAFFFFLQAQVIAQRAATAHRRAEALTVELQEKEKARTLFFHNTSHELRTPLNGIINFSELILQGHFGAVSETAKSTVQKVLRLAQHLKVQVNTILDLAKAKRGELKPNYQYLALAELKSDLDDLAEGLVLKSPLLSYRSSLHEDQSQFVGDGEKIRTILRNLLGNAFKFRDPERVNQVILNIELRAGRLSLTVEDSGIGIPEQFHEKIFEEFGQVDADTRRSYEGTGLGLSMVKKLVDLMDGTMTLSSKPGVGSQFQIEIPSHQQTEGALLDVGAQELSRASIDADIHGTRDKRSTNEDAIRFANENQDSYDVLVIDDNETNCEVIAAILRAHGYRVRYALSGRQGLAMMRKERPDLLLLDMMMPEMSGEDVVKVMRGEDQLVEIPIILITARASEEDRILGLRMGVDDYLPKPIFAEELRLRVRNMMERHRLLKDAESVVQQEKLTHLGAVFAELSHELKNLLGGSVGLELLSAEDGRKSLGGIPLIDEHKNRLGAALVEAGKSRSPAAFVRELPVATEKERRLVQRRILIELGELALEEEHARAFWSSLDQLDLKSLESLECIVRVFGQRRLLLRQMAICRDLTFSALSLTRIGEDRGPCVLGEAWNEVLKIIKLKLRGAQPDLLLEGQDLMIPLGQPIVMQILLNLVLNALDAIYTLAQEHRWIRIRGLDFDGEVIIEVENGGPPIPDEVQTKLFRRGFTTKGTSGNGIGLFVSRKILTRHGAELICVPERGYPCFRIVVPKIKTSPKSDGSDVPRLVG